MMLTRLNVTSAPAVVSSLSLLEPPFSYTCLWAVSGAFGVTPKVNQLLRPPASRLQADLAVQLSGAGESWVFLADDAHGWLELLT